MFNMESLEHTNCKHGKGFQIIFLYSLLFFKNYFFKYVLK